MSKLTTAGLRRTKVANSASSAPMNRVVRSQEELVATLKGFLLFPKEPGGTPLTQRKEFLLSPTVLNYKTKDGF